MPRGNQPARQWRLLQFLSWPPGLAVEAVARERRRGLWKVDAGFRDRLPVPLSLSEIVALPVSSWTHVGSGPTFGLGRYRIQPDGAGDGRAA